ncbi:YdhK family protein [Rothia koreensis]|jgi:hypothetical protein|uniref:YdhK family protein n=1 Tax=Rothia koreensis TaxID=592378 RepID=UPI003F285D77
MRHSVTVVSSLAVLVLASATACSSANTDDSSSASPSASASSSGNMDGMHDMDGGPAPAGLASAENPRFPVGSHVILTADHMSGMKDAEAEITGAFATNTYAVDYQPTDGGSMVKDHKWVVQQELQDAGSERLPDGTPVTIEADHMKGMAGAKGNIASSTDQTVYMVTYTSDGMTMTNHKWVVEDELKAE